MKASVMEETPPRPTVECLKRLYSLYEGYIQSAIKTKKIFLEDKDIASQAISASLLRASRSYFYYDNYLPPDSKEKKALSPSSQDFFHMSWGGMTPVIKSDPRETPLKELTPLTTQGQ